MAIFRTKRNILIGWLIILALLVTPALIFQPELAASIQSGFPVLSRSGNTTGYVNFTGSLTGTGNPCLDGSGNLTVSGCTSGAGTVTHTAGALGASAIVVGNGGADIKTPNTSATMDSSGNIVTPGSVTTGSGGGASGAVDTFDAGSGFKVIMTPGTLTADRTVTQVDVTGKQAVISGAVTTGHCPQFGAGPSLVDSGANCGGGGGGTFPFGPPINIQLSSGLTWVNQGGATISDTFSLLTLSAPVDNGFNFRIMKKAATPIAGAFTFTAWMMPQMFSQAFQRVGIIMRESSTGKFSVVGFYGNGNWHVIVGNWLDPNNQTSQVFDDSVSFQTWGGFPFGVWLRITYDGTNMKYFTSPDGKLFFQIFSQVATTPFTTAPNEIGIGAMCGNSNAYPCGLSIINWMES